MEVAAGRLCSDSWDVGESDGYVVGFVIDEAIDDISNVGEIEGFELRFVTGALVDEVVDGAVGAFVDLLLGAPDGAVGAFVDLLLGAPFGFFVTIFGFFFFGICFFLGTDEIVGALVDVIFFLITFLVPGGWVA